jgi:hypothetical protein
VLFFYPAVRAADYVDVGAVEGAHILCAGKGACLLDEHIKFGSDFDKKVMACLVFVFSNGKTNLDLSYSLQFTAVW